MDENNNTPNNSKDNDNYDTMSIISELKKLKPIEKEYKDLLEKTEELILSQYNTIQRLSDIVLKDDDKGIEDISKTISESYEEFKQQLQIAQYVQKAIFPKKLPSNDIIEINSHLIPMEETSSDFYDVFEILEGRVYGLVVVDVSGHGVSAALVTSMVKMLFSNAVAKYLSPRLVLSYVNKELSKTLKQSSYLSCFYCVIDLYDKEMVYVTAGHTDNMIYDHKAGKLISLSTEGPMVGIDDKFEYEEKKIKLEYGNSLIIYTDGLAKLEDKAGKNFDSNRLKNIIESNKDKPPKEKLNMMTNDIKEFKKDVKQTDDITLMYVTIAEDADEKIKKSSFRVEESQKLISYYKKLLKLKEQDSDKQGIIEVLLNMADIYNALGKYEKSVSYLTDALNLSYGFDDKKISVNIIDRLASLYLKVGNLKKAVEYINKNLKYYKNSDDEENLIDAYSLLAQVYNMQRKPDLAIKYESKSLQLAQKHKKELSMALSYNRIGVYYSTEKNFDKAMEYYNKGSQIIDSLKENAIKAKLLNNIGNLHKGFGNFDEALKLFQNSLKILEEWEDKFTYVTVLHNLGELYMRKGEVETAMDYLNKCIESTYKNHIPSVESSTLVFRAELYYNQNKYKECLEDCLKALNINDETKVDFLRGKVYLIIAKTFSQINEKDKENNKELINNILHICKVSFTPEKFFKEAVSRSKNPIYPETHIPALYEYALFLIGKKDESSNAISMIKDAYHLSIKYGLEYEKKNIENIKKEYNIGN